MSELTAIQKGARLMARLLMHGGVRADEEARRLNIPVSSLYRILGDLSNLREVPVTNDRGWWFVNWLKGSDYDSARRLLTLLRSEINMTSPNTLFCRPLQRTDMVMLERLLARMVEGVHDRVS
jgi:hypothetical protein